MIFSQVLMVAIHGDLRVIFFRQATRLVEDRVPVRVVQRGAHDALAAGSVQEVVLGVIETDVHPATNTEEYQIPRTELLLADADAHMQEIARCYALHGQIEAVLERSPDEAGTVDAALLGTAPFIGGAVPGVHLIVKGGNHRNQIVRSAIDRGILVFGGGFWRMFR